MTGITPGGGIGSGALADYLPLAGGTMTGPILGAVGAVGAPGYSFAGDPDTGIYNPAANALGLTTAGVLRLTVNGTALTATVPVYLPDGTAGAPPLTFTGDPDTGLYRPSADVLGLVVGGAAVARARAGGFSVNSTGTTFGTIENFRVGTPATLENSTNSILAASAASSRILTLQMAAAASGSPFVVTNSAATALAAITSAGLVAAGDGTAAGPGITFLTDTNTGFYRIGADQIGISTGGTLRLAVGTASTIIADGYNLALGSTAGTKIGTATTEKLGFYNTTPVVQPATTGTDTFAAGSGTPALALSAWTGTGSGSAYTVGDIVKALKNLGLLAA